MKIEQELLNNFAYNIRTRRERRCWTQEILSVKAEVTKNTISDIETSQKFARAKTLVKLAKAFETEVYELLKPRNVIPDYPEDIISKYDEEVKDAVDEVAKRYLKKGK